MILQGNALRIPLADESVNCIITSPSYYGLRDYGVAGQLGLEPTPAAYVANLVAVFREVKRVLRKDGTVWLNIGDSYAGSGKGQMGDGSASDRKGAKQGTSAGTLTGGLPTKADGLKPKDLIGIPWRVAFALQEDGWWLRSEITWCKTAPMPESVTDRPTCATEKVFLLSKSARYYYDWEAIAEPSAGFRGSSFTSDYDMQTKAGLGQGPRQERTTRNARNWWAIGPDPFPGSHYAVMPRELAKRCVLAGCPPDGKRCDCDDIINTPTGKGPIDDPSMVTGRAGMNRPRRSDEGTRPITLREQRWEAEQMKQSPHRETMERICGDAFAHYIRTDDSGARPLPEVMRADFMGRGWITHAPPCEHPTGPPGIVLDPFSGSGTTVYVAHGCGRRAIGIDLSATYCEMAQNRNGDMF